MIYNKYAGFWKRFAAHILDQIILGFVHSILLVPVWIYILKEIFQRTNGGAVEDYVMVSGDYFGGFSFTTLLVYIALVAIVSILIDWLYYALMESSTKQATLGKMVLSIKVTDMRGNRIGFGKATGRYFGKIISGMILMIGYIMAGFTEKKQALHDIMSDCLVVNTLYLEDNFNDQQSNLGDHGYERNNI